MYKSTRRNARHRRGRSMGKSDTAKLRDLKKRRAEERADDHTEEERGQ